MEALDNVAFTKVVIVFKSHATFLTGLNIFHFVLETFQGRELALVDHNIVADEPHACTAFDLAFGDQTTGDLADFGNVKDLEDLGIAEEFLA